MASSLALLVAGVLFHKTELVDHPEFVSFPKVLIAFAIWVALMGVAFRVNRGKPARAWVALAFTGILALPAAVQIAKFLLRRFLLRS